jgi:hypothetical protein
MTTISYLEILTLPKTNPLKDCKSHSDCVTLNSAEFNTYFQTGFNCKKLIPRAQTYDIIGHISSALFFYDYSFQFDNDGQKYNFSFNGGSSSNSDFNFNDDNGTGNGAMLYRPEVSISKDGHIVFKQQDEIHVSIILILVYF